MATGDFQDLYSRAIYAAQRDPAVTFDVTRAKEAVNEAYLSICDSGLQWSFLFTQGSQALTIGQESYTYTTLATSLSVPGVSQVLGFQFGGPAGSNPGHYVRWEDYQAIKQLDPALANGVPHLWTTHSDSTVQIWPKPVSGYTATVVALRQPVELVANADVPLIPLAWRAPLLVPCAAAILLRQEGGEALQEAQIHEATYLKNLEAAKQALVQPAPVAQPTPARIELPSALKGATGSFLDLAQRVCYLSGGLPWIQYDLNRAKEALNSVYGAILDTQDEWDFLEQEGQITLTANQDLYSLTSIAAALSLSAVRELKSVVHDSTSVSGQGRLEPLSWQELESLSNSTQDGESTGIPAVYAVWDGKVRFWPKPDQAYTLGVFVLKGDVAKTSNTDTFLLPEEWLYEVLVPLAAARVLAQAPDATQFQKGQVLESQGQAQLKLFRDARAAAKWPTLRLQSPGFSGDLPGGYVDDGYL